MQSTATSVLDRYLEKVIQDNKIIDARGVMQVNRMIELSLEDVFIHLTARMNHSDKKPSVLDDTDWDECIFEPEPDTVYTRKPIPRFSEDLRPASFDFIETKNGAIFPPMLLCSRKK